MTYTEPYQIEKNNKNYQKNNLIKKEKNNHLDQNNQHQVQQQNDHQLDKKSEIESFKWKDVVWLNVFIFLYLHLAAVYGFYLVITGKAQFTAFAFAYLTHLLGAFGTTVGAHRLWAHKCYKAKWQMRFILMIWNSTLYFNSIYDWVRDHRVHHKFTDTNADPHNYSRGFFFAHIGWLMVKKHPDIKLKGGKIDMTDLEQDKIVMFQHKYYYLLMPLLTFVLPTYLSCAWFGESLWNSWHVSAVLRYVIALNYVWSINSVAHSEIFASRPFDKTIKPSDHKWLSILTVGECWHNYHHTFPWDYKAAEFGTYRYNLSVAVIHFFYAIGWAYDLRTVSEEMIAKRAARTGDGSKLISLELTEKLSINQTQKQQQQNHHNNKNHHHHHHHQHNNQYENDENTVWGWDDPDMLVEDKKLVIVTN